MQVVENKSNIKVDRFIPIARTIAGLQEIITAVDDTEGTEYVAFTSDVGISDTLTHLVVEARPDGAWLAWGDNLYIEAISEEALLRALTETVETKVA